MFYILIDCSESMSYYQKLEQVEKGSLEFAQDATKKKYKTGIIEFNDDTRLICEATYDLNVLKKRLSSLHAIGRTNIAGALALAVSYLKNVNGGKYILLATDGDPNIGSPDPYTAAYRQAANAKKRGIEIMTLGTDDAQWDFLNKLRTKTGFVKVVDRKRLQSAIADYAKLLP